MGESWSPISLPLQGKEVAVVSTKKSRKAKKVDIAFDESGEFTSNPGQLPLSTLLLAIDKETVEVNEKKWDACPTPRDVPHVILMSASDCVHGYMFISQVVDDEDLPLLEHLWSLQNPRSSPWNTPLIRLFTHTSPSPFLGSSVNKGDGAGGKGKKVEYTVTFYVYFTRLLFELVADPDIKGLMSRLKALGPVVERAKMKQQPEIFRPSKSGPESQETRFSLAGLLRSAESLGEFGSWLNRLWMTVDHHLFDNKIRD